MQASLECLIGYPELLCPFHDCLCFALECDEVVAAPVSILFAHSRPATVTRHIADGIINTVNRESFGTLSHIG